MLQWYSNDENKAIKSMQDKDKREFGIRFFLEDIRAGTIWTHVTPDDSISVTTGNNNDCISCFFEKNQDGYLKSILIEVVSVGCVEAFKKASKHVFSILSTFCFFYRRPFRIHSIMAIDSKYNIKFFTRKSAPKSEPLKKPLASFSTSPIGSLLAIYRDGMNSIDLPYRYICFFKIYEAWHKYSDKFFNTRKQKPTLYITSNLLAGSYRKNYHQELIGKTFHDKSVFDILNSIRSYLVHPVIDRKVPASFCNLDQIEHLEAIETMSNLIERMATKILDTELGLLAESDASIKTLLNIYKK